MARDFAASVYAIELLEPRRLLATVPPGFTDALVAGGLVSPTAMAIAPDGRIFVSQQGGAVRVIKNGALLGTAFATLPAISDAERGLVGITLDPNFANNGYVYVYYTISTPVIHNRISRLTASGDVAAGGETIILDLPSVNGAQYHMGGALHFGPDGKLYIATGDTENHATPQSLASVFGKILRINPDGSIPDDNPFYTQTTGLNRAIWARGLRNPFTFAFQSGTGRMFINDVGSETWEEIDEGVIGANYGWPISEGPDNTTGFSAPFYYYDHTVGVAIDSATFYNPPSTDFPAEYMGKFFFADYGMGWMKTIDPGTHQVATFATGIVAPVDADVASDGSLYYLGRGPSINAGFVRRIAFQVGAAPIITQQPANQSAAVGEAVTFTVSAAGAGLSYQWQRNTVNIPGATDSTYTVGSIVAGDNGAKFRAVVTNTNGTATSSEATLTVIANHAPQATIIAPSAGSTYRAGDTINYSGSGFDLEQGALLAPAFTWQVDYYTGGLARPFVPATSGSTSGSFVVPTIGPYKKSDVFYRIMLTVTDSGGRSHTATRDILPLVSTVTLASNVPGVVLAIDGQPKPLPYSFTSVVNFQRDIGAPTPQVVNAVTYQFDGWSDAGAVTHTIFTPDVNTTFTATFRPVTTTFLSDLPFVLATNGSGPVERDKSNGGSGAGDGQPITLQGVVYPKGLGVHAFSDVRFNLGGNYSRFVSDIGVDDEVHESGSVRFSVFADSVQIFMSPILDGADDTVSIDLNVSGVQTLQLVVDNGGDGTAFDHADWAGAMLTKLIPTVISSGFLYDSKPHKLQFAFSINVSASLSNADLVLENLTTGQTVPIGLINAPTYDVLTNLATFTFGYPDGILPDGNYRATLLAAGITSPAGVPLAGNHVFNFFHLTGDANHDGIVNVNDFTILAANFGQSNRTFSQGDFNYDTIVNVNDFTILASRFGTVLSAGAPAAIFGRNRLPDDLASKLDLLQ